MQVPSPVCLHAVAPLWTVSVNFHLKIISQWFFPMLKHTTITRKSPRIHLSIAGVSLSLYMSWKYWIIHKISTYFYSEWKNDLKYIRIWFDTPTINKITKDRAAKFVDMLSAIGGTMGLLTGFSLISAVEILYFVTKTVWTRRKVCGTKMDVI